MTDLIDETPVAASVVVARVPVVNRAREIVGFELVSRATHDQGATAPEDDTQPVVTVSGLLGSVDVNLASVVGDKFLFCSVDRAVIESETRLSLPPRRTVLEVPARDVDDEFLESLRAYKQSGFTIMVDHAGWARGNVALQALTDLVKIELDSGTPGEVMDLVEGYQDVSVELLAAGCDTEAELAWAQAVGFDLFLGRAVRVREAATETPDAPLSISQVQLGVELLSLDLDLERIEDILRGDPALVTQLLNMASAGAGGGLRRQVRSLREALVVMGTTRLRQWAALVILGRHSQPQSDSLVTALVRARMCELLAPSRGLDGPFAFTAGLLSALDILFGMPVGNVEQQIKVDEDLTNAAFRRVGPMGQLINRVEAHEQWLVGSQVRPDHDEVTLVGAQAFSWAARYVQAMDTARA